MYSQRIINLNREQFARENGWEPVEHTYAQVQEFIAYINALIKIESNQKNSYISIVRPITEKRKNEIKRWIENEQAMCALSCSYWENNYAWVCNEEGQIFKFAPRMSQKIYNSVVAEFDERQVSIELLILKARQLGITSQTALKFIHRMLFIPHTQAIMASVKEKASELIGRIQNTVYDKCPFWLVPRRMPKGAFDNGSILSIQSGMQATGLAQGWTPTLAHLSEIGDIPNPQKTIEEGLMRAMHISSSLYLCLEGTGAGNTGWLAETWRAAKSDFPKGQHRLCPMFISWPCCPEIYPKEGFLKKFPVQNSWKPELDETRKHVARCETYIRNTPYLAKMMGKDYRMPIEQQWFWEWNYRQASKNHTQKVWAAQMPADDFEALTGVHDSVFDPYVIDKLEEDVYEIITSSDFVRQDKVRREPLQAYAITGHSIPEKYHPREESIDWEKEAIRVTWVSNRGEKYDWELVPLKDFNEDIETETMDKVLVFEPPKEGEEYACGIDTAHGLGKPDEERTSVSIAKKGTGAEFDEQVCELTSNRLSPAQTVPFAACIAAWYGKKCRDPRGVKFAIEQVRGPGDTCQNQLKIMGFNYHHKPGRLDGRKIKEENKNREGWYSNSVSVPILMGRFVEAVEGGWYKPKSKWLIEELKNLERHGSDSGKDKMEHRQGCFDDRVRAAAMSYITFHTYDDLAERAQRRYAAPPSRRTATKGVCRANMVSVGSDGWE